MADTGTAIERTVEGTLARADNAVPVEVISPDHVAVIRDTHAHRADLAGRVLSLLSSLGELALRIMDERTASGSGTATGVAAEVTDAAVTSDRTKLGSARQGRRLGQGKGAGGARRRQRWRGGA